MDNVDVVREEGVKELIETFFKYFNSIGIFI